MNHVKAILEIIFFVGFFFAASILRGQIPASGSDLPSLSSVRWGMTMEEVKKQIGRSAEKLGDTALTFQDSILNSNVHVVLTFGEADSEKGLRSVDVQFDEKNAEHLRTYLKARYGEKYKTENKEKSSLFFTVNFEALIWPLKSESVTMVVFSHGDDVLGLNLLYNRRGR